MSQVITTSSLCHSFGETSVLDKITLSISDGEIFGLLGPSGAGKTTLIKILTGQLRQCDGLAEIMGVDTRKLTAAEHQKIGVMMDNLGLYNRLSVYDNMSFYADIYGTPHSAIDGTLQNFGLYEARKTPVSKLSKGMKNRLSLARALMNNAKVLFLDEPTSGLDPTTSSEIYSILLAQKAKGTTIFLTTHNMFEAESLCDTVALLSKGHIIECGKPKDICKKYNHLDQLSITLRNGQHVSIKNGRESAAIVKEYLENEMIETIHSTEPTLENIFIELTEKGLNKSEEHSCHI